MHAAVVLHGDSASAPWLTGQLEEADLIVAADGGAAAVLAAGRHPDVVIGDLDSLDSASRAALAAGGSTFLRYPPEKDQTDGELAIILACTRGATSVAILGALGGRRLDHAFANVFLLAIPELADRDAWLADPSHTIWLVSGPSRRAIAGARRDLVTLLPLSPGVSGVVTDGLRYPLAGEPLEFGRSRGVSNELLDTEAAVAVETGHLLVVLHRRRPQAA